MKRSRKAYTAEFKREAVRLVKGGLTASQVARDLGLVANLVDALCLRKPYLRVANVYSNRLELSDLSSIGLTDTEWSKTALKTGDLLVVEGNGSLDQIGRVARWNGELAECSHQNHLIRWRSAGDVESKYALFWLMSPRGRSSLMDLASTSAGLYTLSISKVSGVPISVPSIDEQHEIVRRVDELLGFADVLQRRFDDAMFRINGLTPSILAKAFRGELVPQDPTDEPASVLLERIRKGRVDKESVAQLGTNRPASKESSNQPVVRSRSERTSQNSTRATREVSNAPKRASRT